MSNLNSWEEDPAAQEENLAQQTQQMNLGNNQGQGQPAFRPGASTFTPGAASFTPGQAYGGGYGMPQYQQGYYGNQQGYYSQYGGQQYQQYGQGGYGNVYGQQQQQQQYNQGYGEYPSPSRHSVAQLTDHLSLLHRPVPRLSSGPTTEHPTTAAAITAEATSSEADPYHR